MTEIHQEAMVLVPKSVLEHLEALEERSQALIDAYQNHPWAWISAEVKALKSALADSVG